MSNTVQYNQHIPTHQQSLTQGNYNSILFVISYHKIKVETMIHVTPKKLFKAFGFHISTLQPQTLFVTLFSDCTTLYSLLYDVQYLFLLLLIRLFTNINNRNAVINHISNFIRIFYEQIDGSTHALPLIILILRKHSQNRTFSKHSVHA